MPLSPASTAVAHAHQSGSARWPSIVMTVDDFATQLAVLDPSGDHVESHPDDLFLACACLQGLAAAIAVFERELLLPARVVLRRFSAAPDFADEVCQVLRTKLFSAPARIATYSGGGPLAAWVRMALTRTAIDHLRRSKIQPQLGGDLPDEIFRDTDTPESRLLQQASRQSLKRAVESALARLSARDRTLLRLHFLDGMSIDRISALFHIHRATVARRIVHVRRDILNLVGEAVLGPDGRSSTGELRSLWRLAGSQAHISLERLLRESLAGVPSPDDPETERR